MACKAVLGGIDQKGSAWGRKSSGGRAQGRKKPRKEQRMRRRDGRTTNEAVTYVEELTQAVPKRPVDLSAL